MVEGALETMKTDVMPSLHSINEWKEPLIYPSSSSIQGDRDKMTQYIAALRLWVKMSGVESKNQANVVQYSAYQNSPEYFLELDSKFKDSLADKIDGVQQIIKYLEIKFGVNQHSTYSINDNESYPNKAEKMLLVKDPDLEEKKMVDLTEAVWKKKKQQSGAKSKVEAMETMLMKETFETSTVLPVPSTGYLLDYHNQTKKTLMVKETDDTEGIATKAEFFGELERLPLKRKTLASNTNQVETDDIDGTVTKAGFFEELE